MTHLKKPVQTPNLRLGALALVAGAMLGTSAHAGVVDATGDFLATFAGTKNSDLDLVSVQAIHNNGGHTFTLSATTAGAIGQTSNAVYVWGVNRGNGTAAFAANGLTNVLFDRTIQVRANGTVTIGGNAVAGAVVQVIGDTITATLADSFVPSTGFGLDQFTWNLWTRGTGAGFAGNADFAPDNANFATTAVPEPASLALMLIGLGVMVGVGRRRRTV